MIKVNGEVINVEKFPDGTQRIMDFKSSLFDDNENAYFNIVWLYETDAEMFTLMCVVNHIRDNHWYGSNAIIHLTMPYIPNARMDRVHSQKEVFTLKHFANFINSLKFDKVKVFDAHSNVSLAVINRIVTIDYVDSFIRNEVMRDIKDKNLIIYFPDAGSYNRYKNLTAIEYNTKLYGEKVRDWQTGKILRIDIRNENNDVIIPNDISGKSILMIDDIISYGGTMAYSADRLEELGANKIYAYASHTENSVLDQEKGTFLKRLDYGIIDKLYTTNSIYNGKHKDIKVIYEF